MDLERKGAAGNVVGNTERDQQVVGQQQVQDLSLIHICVGAGRFGGATLVAGPRFPAGAGLMAGAASPPRSRFLLRAPPAANRSRARLDRAARWPLGLAILGLVLYLLLSDNLLVTLGIPYNVPRGAFPFKIHPGTYFISLGFVLLLRGNPWQRLGKLLQLAPALSSLALVTTVIMVYALIRFGASGSGFFIDTLLAPALLGLIVLQAPSERRPVVFWIVLGLSACNAVIGIGEAAVGNRLVPYMAGDKLLVEEFFRATALGGHPLTNALRTAVLMLSLIHI